jgi:3-dehydroquinate dehydratase-2
MTRRVLVLNGPNLNLLGIREPEVYGFQTLDDIMATMHAHAAGRDVVLTHLQSNAEGDLITALHEARTTVDGIVFNAGSLTHSSYGLRDAIAGIDLPVVETHLSNVHARESFRHVSVIAGVCLGVVAGFGADSYLLALDALLRHLDRG